MGFRANRVHVFTACVLVCWLLAPPITRGQKWSRFEWVGAEMGGRRFEKASVFLPVRVRGVEGVYFMQLDTGSPRTLLYEVPYRQLLKEQGVPGAEAAGRFATATFSGSHRPPTRTDGTAAEQVSQRGPEAEWSVKKTLHKC